MSLSSLFLAFAPAIAARFKREEPDRDAEIAGLEAKLAGALSERDALIQELERAWRTVDQLGREAAMWRDRAMPLRAAPPIQLGGELALQQGPNQSMQQQLTGFQQDLYPLAQSQAGAFCNCVPARHDMFLRGQ